MESRSGIQQHYLYSPLGAAGGVWDRVFFGQPLGHVSLVFNGFLAARGSGGIRSGLSHSQQKAVSSIRAANPA